MTIASATAATLTVRHCPASAAVAPTGRAASAEVTEADVDAMVQNLREQRPRCCAHARMMFRPDVRKHWQHWPHVRDACERYGLM